MSHSYEYVLETLECDFTDYEFDFVRRAFENASSIDMGAPFDVEQACEVLLTAYKASGRDFEAIWARVGLVEYLQQNGHEIRKEHYLLFAPFSYDEASVLQQATVLPAPPTVLSDYSDTRGGWEDFDKKDKYLEDWSCRYADKLSDKTCHYDEEEPQLLLPGIKEFEERDYGPGVRGIYMFGFLEVYQREVGLLVCDKTVFIYSWDHEMPEYPRDEGSLLTFAKKFIS
jgi:hypothetical protein